MIFKKQEHSLFRSRCFLFLLATLLFHFNGNALSTLPKDSVVEMVLNPASPPADQQNLLNHLNKEQLNDLVDELMEMDTIPPQLLKQVQLAVVNFKATEKKQENNSDENGLPSSDLYSCWEINSLFPEKDMLKLTGDTSVTLVLRGGDKGEYAHPFNGPVTSIFGWRDSTQHKGIDIDLNKGDKVVAAFDGMVRVARRYGGFGNVVIIRHYNGLETVYAHLSKIKVKPGQVIKAGQLLGLGGSTGHSTGSHLHFEVRFKGVPINPQYLISFTNQQLLCSELIIKKTKWGLAAYPKDAKYYTVEKGDTIFEIAKRFATTTASIKQMNGFSGRIRLKVGQQVNVMQ